MLKTGKNCKKIIKITKYLNYNKCICRHVATLQSLYNATCYDMVMVITLSGLGSGQLTDGTEFIFYCLTIPGHSVLTVEKIMVQISYEGAPIA